MSSVNNPDTVHAPILAALNTPWQGALCYGQKMSLPGHTYLSFNGQEYLDFFYLAKGCILAMHADVDGKERTIFRIEQGSIFNEAPAAAGFDVPDSPFYSLEECVLYRFPHDLLRNKQFVAANPDLIINLINGLGIKLLIIHTYQPEQFHGGAGADQSEQVFRQSGAQAQGTML